MKTFQQYFPKSKQTVIAAAAAFAAVSLYQAAPAFSEEAPEAESAALISPDPLAAVLDPWYSFQDTLEEEANLEIGFGITTVLQFASDTVDDADSLLTFSWDLGGVWNPIDDENYGTGSLGFLVEGGQPVDHNIDEDLSGNIGTALGINDDADGQDIAITELWWEQVLLDGVVTITVGKIDQTVFFDQNAVANDETAAFLATPLVNSSAIGFPDNGLGVNVWVDISDMVYITFGFGDANADARESGFSTIDGDELFTAFEVGFNVDLFDRPGTYRFLLWSTEVDDGAGGADSSGFSFSFDQQVFCDKLILFGRASVADDDEGAVDFRELVSVGVGVESPFGRADDFAGIAFVHAEEGGTGASETLVESFYRFKLTETIEISPALQIISNPIGNPGESTVLVGALRTQFTF